MIKIVDEQFINLDSESAEQRRIFKSLSRLQKSIHEKDEILNKIIRKMVLMKWRCEVARPKGRVFTP